MRGAAWSRAAAITTGTTDAANQGRAKSRTLIYVSGFARSLLRSRQTYGSPRIAHALGLPRKTQPHRPSHARRSGLYARQRSKYRAVTTDSRHDGPIAPNRAPTSSPCNDAIRSGHRCHLHAHQLKAG